MDGIPATRHRMKPAADPQIARVKLPMLFAWLAEPEAGLPPAVVFEANGPVSNAFPPPKHRRQRMPSQREVVFTDVVLQPAEDAVAIPAPAPELAPAPMPVAEFDVPAPQPLAVAALDDAPEDPPFLPPPLIAAVISPRPILSRADDFLPGRPDQISAKPWRR